MSNSSKFVTALTLSLLFSVHSFAGKETLKQGWEAFNTNKRKEAKELFITAAKDADTKAEANLALSLVYWSEDKNKEASEAFKNFYSASTDPYPYLYALWTSPVAFDGYDKKDEAHLKFLRKQNKFD